GGRAHGPGDRRLRLPERRPGGLARDARGAARPRCAQDRPDRKAGEHRLHTRAPKDPLRENHAPPPARRGRETATRRYDDTRRPDRRRGDPRPLGRRGAGRMSEERQRGVDLYNEAWRLMESRKDDDRLLHITHASRYHWGEAEECKPENLARGEWQISRVYTVLGRPEPAIWHARRCLEHCETNG